MRKIDDSGIYFWTGIVTAVLALMLGAVYMYSAFKVEPEIKALLAATVNVDRNYKKAYILLRDPQIFARYEFFDEPSRPGEGKIRGKYVKEILTAFDRKVYEGKEFTPDDRTYLDIILDRRTRGGELTRNSSAFLILISLLSWIMFIIEKRQSLKK